jgi:predicted RecA/RadA family phage recombinase
MARNEHMAKADHISVPVPAGTKSGDPVLVGSLPGYAVTGRGEGGNDTGNASVWFDGSAKVPVTGAITAVGQPVYIPTGGGALTATVGSNVVWGYALATKGAGTGVIPVKIAKV